MFDGILLDWSATLAFDPPLELRIRWALTRLGRPSDDDELDELAHRLRQAARLPEVIAAVQDYDRDASLHRAGKALLFQRAGLDDALADTMYSFDTQPTNRPLFPDVAAVLRRYTPDRPSGRRRGNGPACELTRQRRPLSYAEPTGVSRVRSPSTLTVPVLEGWIHVAAMTARTASGMLCSSASVA